MVTHNKYINTAYINITIRKHHQSSVVVVDDNNEEEEEKSEKANVRCGAFDVRENR